jgi:hypothetical protein
VTAPLAPPPAASTWWEDEGRRIAERLRETSAVIVIGTSTDHAARVALGIARAESERRHVALGDLVGDAAPLYAVAGGEDAFGLSDCLRQGLPLNDIARPAPDRDTLFVLPAGSPPVACEEILGHERWPRLVNGFAEVGALLVLVAPLDAPGLAMLAGAAGGVVLVEVDEARAGALHVLAAVAPPVAPLRAARPPGPATDRGRRRRTRLAFVAIGVIAVLAAAGWLGRRRIITAYRALAATRTVPRPAVPSAVEPVPVSVPAPPPADTVRLSDPVNPADTSSIAPFAVEVMAANTVTGANSFLSENSRSALLIGATLSPVASGGSSSVWYKVVIGASHVRAGADSLLGALRWEGLVSSDQGRVVQVPYALLLASGLERRQAVRLLDAWRQRGFNPYLLVQGDQTVSVLAGAFETTAQAAALASALRAAGVAPVLVFRTGRTY